MMNLYKTIGYQCVEVQSTADAPEGKRLDQLKPLLEGKVTLMSGNSGVGKSTIINELLPNAQLRTAEISDAHNTGMHTCLLYTSPSPRDRG